MNADLYSWIDGKRRSWESVLFPRSYLLAVDVYCLFLYITGVIEVLVNSCRQIDAVNLAFAFELTEQFSPVPLLKSYLKEARKATSPVKHGNASPTAQVLFSLMYF